MRIILADSEKLVGLLALTVEFYRANPTSCILDADGASTVFPYSEDNMCNLICSVNDERSPTSPIRQGSEDNIYIIPEPHLLTFGAATLVAAACCIPAILSMISMWDKIVEINWKSRFGGRDVDGAGVAAAREMKGVNAMVRGFLSAVEIPLFSSAVLAILIVGELNFWSEQVYYQTETITGIGTCRILFFWTSADPMQDNGRLSSDPLLLPVGHSTCCWRRILRRQRLRISVQGDHIAGAPALITTLQRATGVPPIRPPGPVRAVP